jgi:hypothetical protein
MKHYVEPLEISENRLGPDDHAVGETLNMMGFLQAKNRRIGRCSRITLGRTSNTKVARGQNKSFQNAKNIGNVHREKQDCDLSMECYEECLRIRRAELGNGHEKVADALIALGNAMCDLEFDEEAMDSFKEGTSNEQVNTFPM